MNPTWHLRGPCVGLAWALRGPCVGPAWAMRVPRRAHANGVPPWNMQKKETTTPIHGYEETSLLGTCETKNTNNTRHDFVKRSLLGIWEKKK